MSALWPHGSATGYKTMGCRCDHCRAYQSDLSRRSRLRRGGGVRLAQKQPRELFWTDLTDPRHGTDNGYGNLGCRCARCRAAHTHERQRRIEEHVQRPVPEGQHGTHAAYTLYRCRCDICVTWRKGYVHDYHQRAKRGHRAA